MNLEEIIKKITAFLKFKIYKSEKFFERFVSFVMTYILYNLINDMESYIYNDFGHLLKQILRLSLDYSYRGWDELILFIFMISLVLILYFINRALYRLAIKRFRG